MNPTLPPLSSDDAWNEIARASDQPAAYFAWCRKVLDAYDAGEVDGEAAARMIGYRDDMQPFPQLQQSGDAQLVMSHAEDIVDGTITVDAPDDPISRKWHDISVIVARHT